MEHSEFIPDKNVVDDTWSELHAGHRWAPWPGSANNIVSRCYFCYFQGKSVRRSSPAPMAVSEETAKKRLARALEMLRKLLAGRGLIITSALLASTLAARATQAAPLALQQVLSRSGCRADWRSFTNGPGNQQRERLSRQAVERRSRVPRGHGGRISARVARDRQAEARDGGNSIRLPFAPAPQTAPPSQSSPAAVATAWPITLPGTITGSPMAVDLDGDGKLSEIVVAYMGMDLRMPPAEMARRRAVYSRISPPRWPPSTPMALRSPAGPSRSCLPRSTWLPRMKHFPPGGAVRRR